jgi:hypothetical protein
MYKNMKAAFWFLDLTFCYLHPFSEITNKCTYVWQFVKIVVLLTIIGFACYLLVATVPWSQFSAMPMGEVVFHVLGVIEILLSLCSVVFFAYWSGSGERDMFVTPPTRVRCAGKLHQLFRFVQSVNSCNGCVRYKKTLFVTKCVFSVIVLVGVCATCTLSVLSAAMTNSTANNATLTDSGDSINFENWMGIGACAHLHARTFIQ